MIMGRFWTGAAGLSILCAVLQHRGAALASAVLQGAQTGVALAISMTGALCLWSGVGRLLVCSGISGQVTRRMLPVLTRLFPSARENRALADALSANVCANLLGLGNAATPMGIRAAKALNRDGTANAELCRLVVLNTASIQLIPTTVAAVRSGLGSEAPFAILPAVWCTSVCAVGMGLAAAFLLEKIWKA